MTEIDTSRDAVERPAYLIRKRGLYYRPNSQGYTTSVIQAGRYTLAEAEDITHPNGQNGPRGGMTFIHEDQKARDEDWAAYRAMRARAEKAEAERDELAKYAHEATVALTSLTPGGSEYFGRQIGDIYTADLQACVAVVRDRFERSEKRLRAMRAERDAAWNDAIEAAAEVAERDKGRFDTPDRIRALRKGGEDG